MHLPSTQLQPDTSTRPQSLQSPGMLLLSKPEIHRHEFSVYRSEDTVDCPSESVDAEVAGLADLPAPPSTLTLTGLERTGGGHSMDVDPPPPPHMGGSMVHCDAPQP